MATAKHTFPLLPPDQGITSGPFHALSLRETGPLSEHPFKLCGSRLVLAPKFTPKFPGRGLIPVPALSQAGRFAAGLSTDL